MFTKRLILFLSIVYAMLLAGCNHTQATETFIPTVTFTPRPSWTLTPYSFTPITPTPLPPTQPSVPAVSPPTPTPWLYQVQKGDTMLGIALHFGVPLEELEQANPGVDPQLLQVGMRLIIPVNTDNPAGLPTPTPIPLTVGAPFCAPAVDSGVVCMVTVANPGPQTVEAVSVWVALENGEAQAVETLSNLLPAGNTTVAVVRFAPPAPPQPRASARLLRALPVDAQRLRKRFLQTSLSATTTVIADNGRSAQIKGQITVTHGNARQVWVVAVAYDEQGHPVGARRWEAPGAEEGRPLSFAFTVYTIGPSIESVALFAEAHAVESTVPSP